MSISRRPLLLAAAAGLLLPTLPRRAAALDYPTRPVRMVVGFPAGGSADIVARIVAQALTERLGQTFIVDNKPGAGSNLGTESVARSNPDGYTLMADSVSNAINPSLYRNLNYDQIKDLVPVASIDVVPNVMDVNPTPRPIPARSPWGRAASAHHRTSPASCSR
jgi:tripartite-type tricarboxylate transporter receptor subunit TctC